jgi:4-diphosphocytidyl-2-C-methyl-D-erythritol kinase
MRTLTQTLSIRAYAKVNLGLRVVGRRPDGYHEIDTVLQSIDLCDHITLAPRRDGEISLKTTPDFGIPPDENLALRAARLLNERVGLPMGVRILLDKEIPVGAGLGGGSSDAAAVLRGLNRLFGLGLDAEALMELGAELGSDVPFFLMGGCCRARGRGERLEKLSVSDAELNNIYVLFVPPFSLSAREVYGAFERLRPQALDSPYPNDLEGAALALRPELRPYREFLKSAGAPFGMSGSGPTYFAVVDSETEAAEILRRAERGLCEETRRLLCRSVTAGSDVVPQP